MGREERARRERGRGVGLSEPQGGRDVITTPLPRFGLPGQRQYLVLRKRFRTGDARNDIPPGGRVGEYRVVLTLARPGFLPGSDSNFSFDETIPGDSHLAIAPPALAAKDKTLNPTHIEIETGTGTEHFTFLGHPNQHGFLGRLETSFNADNFGDALRRAHDAIAPQLSVWSAQLDIPMFIWRIHITEKETGSMEIGIINPFQEAHPLGDEATMTPEFASFASFYREALESNSDVYQFLCLFKIAEGVRNRRARLAAEAKTKGENFTRAEERIPGDPKEFAPFLDALYPNRRWDPMALDAVFIEEARDRKFGDLMKHELDDLRNDIAHALSDTTGTITMSVDATLHIARVRKWLGLMKVIVRRMLKNEFPGEYLPFLKEDGTLTI
jgi:hypothetical protein